MPCITIKLSRIFLEQGERSNELLLVLAKEVKRRAAKVAALDLLPNEFWVYVLETKGTQGVLEHTHISIEMLRHPKGSAERTPDVVQALEKAVGDAVADCLNEAFPKLGSQMWVCTHLLESGYHREF